MIYKNLSISEMIQLNIKYGDKAEMFNQDYKVLDYSLQEGVLLENPYGMRRYFTLKQLHSNNVIFDIN